MMASARDTIERDIGRRLEKARLFRRRSLQSLANELGLTYQQVRKYELGQNRISASTLFRLAQVLDVEVEFFFQEIDRVGERGEPAGTSMTDRTLLPVLDRIDDPLVRRRLLDLVRALGQAAPSKDADPDGGSPLRE